jgi:hypothetical protein
MANVPPNMSRLRTGLHLHYTLRPHVMHEGHFTMTYDMVQSTVNACWEITYALYTAKIFNRRAGKEAM